MTMKLIATSLAVLALSACATKPKIEPIIEQPVAEAPPQIFETAPPLINLAESRAFILDMIVTR